MQALVHFTVGVAIALVLLTFSNRPVRKEFLLTFASGFWALIPDFHWMLREFGFTQGAMTWRAFHQTGYVNLFWFHHLIDALETGRTKLESGIALLTLAVAVIGYYRYNDWSVQSFESDE